jgi:hypothetical protein
MRAKRAEIEARRAARESERAQSDEMQRESRALALAEALEKAEIEHGAIGRKIAVVETSEGSVIVKRAPAALFHRFQEQIAKEVSILECQKLVRPCVVFPSMAEFEILIAEQPAVINACVNEIQRLAGVRMGEVREK